MNSYIGEVIDGMTELALVGEQTWRKQDKFVGAAASGTRRGGGGGGGGERGPARHTGRNMGEMTSERVWYLGQ